jgi:hypothetical protein
MRWQSDRVSFPPRIKYGVAIQTPSPRRRKIIKNSPSKGGTVFTGKPGFPASSAGQALLEFIPLEIGAGMTFQLNEFLIHHTRRT